MCADWDHSEEYANESVNKTGNASRHDVEDRTLSTARVVGAWGLRVGDPDVFCERMRAQEAGDSLIRRSRELNGELVPRPAGGRRYEVHSLKSNNQSTGLAARRKAKADDPDRFDVQGKQLGYPRAAAAFLYEHD